MRQSSLSRSPLRTSLAVVLSGLLASCGGGGSGGVTPPTEVVGACGQPGVTTGYAGGYTDAGLQTPGSCDYVSYDPGFGGDGGGGSAGGDGGGAGGGGAEGVFRNVLVRVYLQDGSLLGEATVDPVTGMVTIRAPFRYDAQGRPVVTYQGPVLIEFAGKADGSSTYYDEAQQRWVAFRSDERLRALVPSFDYTSRNVGVTPLTEAAYQLYLNARSSASPFPLDRAAIQAANDRVLSAVNALLPDRQLPDLSRLPYLVGEGTGTSTIADTENGYYGLVLAGLAISAGSFNPTLERPAITLSRQLATDLADGVLDFIGPDGAPVASAATATYAPATLVNALSTSIDTASGRYAQPALSDTLGATVLGFSVWPDSATGQAGMVRLLSSGVLGYGGATFSGVTSIAPGLGAGYALRADGGLLASGPNGEGQLGTGSLASASGVVSVSGFGPARAATSVAGGTLHALARTAIGEVFVWGGNGAGQLGLPASTRALPTPTKLVDAPAAVLVAAGVTSSHLLSQDGKIYSWGTGAYGELGLGAAVRQQSTPSQVVLPDLATALDCARHCLALTRAGKVYGWGRNLYGGVGSGFSTDVWSPAEVLFGGAGRVLAVAVNGDGSSFAMDANGLLYGWGNDPVGASSVRNAPAAFPVATPKMVALYRFGQQVFARSADGAVHLLNGLTATPVIAAQAS